VALVATPTNQTARLADLHRSWLLSIQSNGRPDHLPDFLVPITV